MFVHRKCWHLFGACVYTLLWMHGSMASMSDHMKKMKMVKDKILKDYDKNIRPTLEGSNTTEVNTGFIPRQIIDLDEETCLFHLDSFFYMSWVDPRLQWNATTEYDGFLSLPPSLLWVPDISVYNSHSVQVDPIQEVLLSVHSTGRVVWIPPILTQTSCPSVSNTSYPYDEVICVIVLGSWTSSGWEIDLNHWDMLYMDEFENIHPRWKLNVEGTRMLRNVTNYEGYDEPYISLHASFPIVRRLPQEIEIANYPCILVMLMTLSIFWLPTDSSKKILLGGVLFLVLNILVIYVASKTKYPLGATLAVAFVQSTMYLVVATLLIQVVIISKLCSLSGPRRPPATITELLKGPVGKYMCLRWPLGEDNLPLDRVQLKEESSTIYSPTANDEWVLLATGLDRVFFVVMAIAMISVHHL